MRHRSGEARPFLRKTKRLRAGQLGLRGWVLSLKATVHTSFDPYCELENCKINASFFGESHFGLKTTKKAMSVWGRWTQPHKPLGQQLVTSLSHLASAIRGRLFNRGHGLLVETNVTNATTILEGPMKHRQPHFYWSGATLRFPCKTSPELYSNRCKPKPNRTTRTESPSTWAKNNACLSTPKVYWWPWVKSQIVPPVNINQSPLEWTKMD